MEIPASTYRCQLNKNFTFAAVANILDYLKALGIHTLYFSPIFKARAGSMHGYDCIDMSNPNPELGTKEECENLMRLILQKEMRVLLDIVPNHSVFSSENYFLMDVLEKGPSSPFAKRFDIEWEHPYENLKGRLLVPFLGDLLANCLLRGEIKLTLTSAGLQLTYFDWVFPVRIESYKRLFSLNLSSLQGKFGAGHPSIVKMEGVIAFLSKLDSEVKSSPPLDYSTFIHNLTWELNNDDPLIQEHFKKNLEIFNGIPGDMESYNELSNLIKEQHYRLAFWKTGTEEINYRRFFAINELIALRMEDEEVFTQTHSWLAELFTKKLIAGVRVDHIDGLRDPRMYLERLRKIAGNAYILVEKILCGDETLHISWPIQGTSGYDFLGKTVALFCDPSKENAATKIYRHFTDISLDMAEIERVCKKKMIETDLPADIDNLAFVLKSIAAKRRYGLDLTMHALQKALIHVLIYFPVYRTYITLEESRDEDKAIIEKVIENCKKDFPDYFHEFDLIGMCLLAPWDTNRSLEEKMQWFHFALSFQQYTGLVMAKSVEDTAFYRYNRLIALNEVGCDPGKFGTTLQAFHNFLSLRSKEWPHTLNATMTHDAKRGEDARMRIVVLSENPGTWQRAMRRWTNLNHKFKVYINGKLFPTINFEYFIYQSMLGSCPTEGLGLSDFKTRLHAFLLKAAREAKINTSWQFPHAETEATLKDFIESIFSQENSSEFLASFAEIFTFIKHWGMINSLAALGLRLTAPGVPDTYQGTEIWDLSFVDPDNRRAVDFEARDKILKSLPTPSAQNVQLLLENADTGQIKLYVLSKLLSLRLHCRELFTNGAYVPCRVLGKNSRHALAFLRTLPGHPSVLIVVPRFLSQLEGLSAIGISLAAWQKCMRDINLDLLSHIEVADCGIYTNIFTHKEIEITSKTHLQSLLQDFPIGVFVKEKPLSDLT